MRIYVLTSSRADFGIYLPLLKKLHHDPFFDLRLIAFGTHLSPFHGSTISSIEQEGLPVHRAVETLVLGDSSEAVSAAIGLTVVKFSSIWAAEQQEADLILCLGDRFEMLAAVLASVPFNIPVAHIHGGETTLGAIDNKFRHSLTLMADYHFATTEGHRKKVTELTGNTAHAYNVGALSLDNLNDMQMLDLDQFWQKYQIDLSKPTALVTFHPETVQVEKNGPYVDELVKAMSLLPQYQFVITMPNADTQGALVRMKLQAFAQQQANVHLVESFGTLGYMSCMKHCAFLLGNTSSGILEAASFGKYVINLGDRQKGREAGDNVIHCPLEADKILDAVKQIEQAPHPGFHNIYGNSQSADQIIAVLKKIQAPTTDSQPTV